MDTIKKILAALLFIVTGAFLFERSRRKSAEAVADNKEILDEINKGDQELSKNAGQLESEELKREEIKKEVKDEQANTDANADFFNKRSSND